MKKLGLPPAGEMKKAIVAGVTAFTGSAITALSDGTLTFAEAAVAVLTGLAAAAGTFAITNDSGPQ